MYHTVIDDDAHLKNGSIQQMGGRRSFFLILDYG